jgi:hypothetical protein
MPSDFAPKSDQTAPGGIDSPSTEDDQGAAPENKIMLDDEMSEDGGLANAQDGETWTFTVKATKSGDGWQPVSVMDAKMAGPEKMGDEDEEDEKKPKPGVRSPMDLGMANSDGDPALV